MKQIKTDKLFNILNIKTINTELRCIMVEEKPKGLVILISDSLIKDINGLKGFKIIREENERYLELVGLNFKIKLEKFTKLNINKTLMYVEEFEENKFRLTFSHNFIEDISKIEEIQII